MQYHKIEKTLSKTKREAFKKLSEPLKLRYLSTLLGNRDNSLISPKIEVPTFYDVPKVYTESREFLQSFIAKNRRLYDLSSQKKPTDKNTDWVGVEIECYLRKDLFEEGQGECDGTCRDDCECRDCSHCSASHDDWECSCECNEDCGGNGFNYIETVKNKLKQLKIKNVQVVEDGSLDNEDSEKFGLEIKVLFRASEPNNLRRVCEFLNENEAMVDTTTGLHVHLDARNSVDANDIIKNFRYSLSKLVKMIPESRRENRYCQYGVGLNDRYYMVNATSLQKHGTIEIRMHSGTVSFEKIYNWVTLLSTIKNNQDAFSPNIGLLTWMRILKLDETLTKWVESRVKKFSGENAIEEYTEEGNETPDQAIAALSELVGPIENSNVITIIDSNASNTITIDNVTYQVTTNYQEESA